MICYNCGSQIADGSTFCPVCGTDKVLPPAPETPAPVCQQPVYQQPVYQSAVQTERKKPSGCGWAFAVLLLITAVIMLGSGIVVSCSACILGSEIDEVLVPVAEGEWFTVDGEEFIDINKPNADGIHKVDSDRLSEALFGSEDAVIVMMDVQNGNMVYSTAVLDAELDGESARFIVYFNDSMLTIEDDDANRLTLVRECEEEDVSYLRSFLEGTEWTGGNAHAEVSFEFGEGVGIYSRNSFETGFDWSVYGDYLTLYFPDSDETVIYYAEADELTPELLTVSRFQVSGINDTEAVIWNSLMLERK